MLWTFYFFYRLRTVPVTWPTTACNLQIVRSSSLPCVKGSPLPTHLKSVNTQSLPPPPASLPPTIYIWSWTDPGPVKLSKYLHCRVLGYRVKTLDCVQSPAWIGWKIPRFWCRPKYNASCWKFCIQNLYKGMAQLLLGQAWWKTFGTVGSLGLLL